MKTVNHYDIYNEEERYNGCVTVMYTALASSEEEVRELAEEQGVDLDGLTIELTRRNVRDQLGRPYKPVFEEELYQ